MTIINNNTQEASSNNLNVSSATINNDNNNGLLPLLNQAIPTITSYKVLDSVVQANAEGVRILASRDNDEHNKEISTELFVKRINASKYAHKKWADLRRTLLYARTEIRFYDEFLPLLRSKLSCGWPIAPDSYFADCDLRDLVHEHENPCAVDALPANASLDDDGAIDADALVNRGGTLILKSINPAHHMQDSPLTTKQASLCLAAAAKLHAAGWQDTDLLQRASLRLCHNGGSYHLRIRNPKELHNMEQSWTHFVENFTSVAPDGFFEKEGVKDLGTRIKDIAEYVSIELSPKPTDDYATIVHGDYKGMNIFIPSDNNDNDGDGDSTSDDCIIIDFASAGVGLGMSDVAMHITHAVRPEDLVDGGEEQLVDDYLSALRKSLPEGMKPYPREVALRHYRLATIDYFRFILGRFWRSASLESFEKRKNSKNATLVNRNLDAALNFVERVVKCMNSVEKEWEVRKNSV